MLEKSKDEELGELTGELNAGRSKFKQQRKLFHQGQCQFIFVT